MSLPRHTLTVSHVVSLASETTSHEHFTSSIALQVVTFEPPCSIIRPARPSAYKNYISAIILYTIRSSFLFIKNIIIIIGIIIIINISAALVLKLCKVPFIYFYFLFAIYLFPLHKKSI